MIIIVCQLFIPDDDALGDHLHDFDPDHNYYDRIIEENNIFSSYDSVDEFLNNSPVSNNDKNFICLTLKTKFAKNCFCRDEI